MRRIFNTIFLLIFLFLGVGTLGVGIFLAVRTISFITSATHTQGTVVAMDSHSTTTRRAGRRYRHSTSRTHRPVFEFKDAQGVVHRVTESVGSNPPAFAKGETVPVLYDPTNPGRAHIDANLTLWFGAGLVTLMGTVFTVVGVFLWRKETRQGRTVG